MKALIFGVTGQDGYYLIELCKKKGIDPIGVSRSGPISADIADRAVVEKLIRTITPQYIFHLAANSTTSYEALFENHQTISSGTWNILDSVKRHVPEAKVFITGSGVQFHNTGSPISETDPFEASSPYAVARIQSVYAARYYKSLGIKTYVGYLFHHESPMRKPNHVSQMIVQAAQRIRDGGREKIELGDLNAEKEWTFAGDTVAGIWTLLQQDVISEAVIGSGKAFSIQRWLEECFGIIEKDWRDYVVLKKEFVPEYRRLVSNPQRIQSLGWHPTVGITDLARMMINR